MACWPFVMLYRLHMARSVSPWRGERKASCALGGRIGGHGAKAYHEPRSALAGRDASRPARVLMQGRADRGKAEGGLPRSGWTPPTGCFGTRSAAAQEYRPGLGPEVVNVARRYRLFMRSTRAPRPSRPTGGARKAVDKAGFATALWRARLPALPTATQPPFIAPEPPKTPAGLTYPPRRNMIASIRGSERWVAGFKSESWPASEQA